MDKDNFEQQFYQDLRSNISGGHPATPSATTVSPTSATPVQPAISSSTPSKLPLIISIVLATVVLFESIALVIALTNHSSSTDYEDYEELEEDVSYEADVDSPYVYDDNNDLVAMEISCTASDGSKFTLTKTNSFQVYDPSSEIIDSGTYSITNYSLISLTSPGDNNGKVLYHDGIYLADGTKLYDCDQEIFEEDEG